MAGLARKRNGGESQEEAISRKAIIALWRRSGWEVGSLDDRREVWG